jgi:hypothetical protein
MRRGLQQRPEASVFGPSRHTLSLSLALILTHNAAPRIGRLQLCLMRYDVRGQVHRMCYEDAVRPRPGGARQQPVPPALSVPSPAGSSASSHPPRHTGGDPPRLVARTRSQPRHWPCRRNASQRFTQPLLPCPLTSGVGRVRRPSLATAPTAHAARHLRQAPSGGDPCP